ncbi:MAG: hypothetical protein HW405_12 [Candidatus Berkelbacteria bacterium]|nr:hypothetical protein [Candidatus Berkelbacteria bacterium]
MPEYHFPIPGSVDEEKIIIFVRKHWVSFIGPFLLSAAMLLIPGGLIIGLFLSEFDILKGFVVHIVVLGLSIYYLIAVTVAFVSFISFYYDIYIVSRDYIVDVVQEGFWGRKISQISLLRVQDVSSNIQGFLPTLFAYGDVLVETAGEQTQNFLLKSVPNPQEIAAKIMQLHNDLIETEGRHHQILEAEGALAPGVIREGGHHAGEEGSLTAKQPTGENSPASQEIPPQKDFQDSSNNSGDVQIPQAHEESSVPKSSEKVQETEDESWPKTQHNGEGEISHNELDKGGEIDLK